MKQPVTGIILAGGRSKRLGQDKSFLKIGDKTTLNILMEKLSHLCREIILSVKSPQKYRHINGVKLATDILPIHSSLVGIYSALSAMHSSYGFVIACDMPLVETKLINHLIKSRKGFDVIIPESPAGLEPLCAVYSKKCLGPMKQLIKQGDFKIINFFPQVRLKTIKLAEISGLNKTSFFNINTMQDYYEVRKTFQK